MGKVWLQDPLGEHTWLVQCAGKCFGKGFLQLTSVSSCLFLNIKGSVGRNMLKDHGSSH